MADPLSVFGGTFGEGLVSEASLGIFQPDIVGAREEADYPMAATVGRAAGTIAGFLGTTIATGGLLKIGLAPFRFGRSILRASGAMGKLEQVAFGSIQRGTAGAIATGMNFSAQDAAREFVKQMKTEDPDAWAIGHAAASGALVGGVFGMFHNATVFSHPATQVLAGGVSFAVADAVATAAEGEPITQEAVTTSFLMGSALSALGARGWREKNRESMRQLEEAALKIRNEVNNPEAGLGKTVYSILQTHEPEALKMLEKYGYTKEAIENLKFGKLGRSMRVEETGGLTTKGKGTYGVKSSGKEALRPLYDLSKTLGMLEYGKTESTVIGELFVGGLPKGRPPVGAGTSIRSQPKSTNKYNETGRKIIKNIIGRDVERPSQLTNDEAKLFHKTVTDLVLKDIFHGYDPYQIKVAGHGSAGTLWGSAENKMMRYGAADLVYDPTAASRIREIEARSIEAMAHSSARVFDLAIGGSLKGKFQKFKTGAPATANMEKLYDILTIPDQTKYESVLKSLPSDAREAVKVFRKTTDYFYTRTNQALEAMGSPKFESREGYMHAIRQFADGAESGAMKEIFGDLGKIGRRSMKSLRKKKIEITEQGTGQRKVVESYSVNPSLMPREGAGEIIKDPVRAITAMANYDLKTMYLDNPIGLLKARMAILREAGHINAGGEKAIVDYVNTFLLRQATDKSIEWNSKLAASLKDAKVDKLYDGLMKRLTGRDWANRPLDAFDSAWGKGVSSAFIVGRPDLALRNTTQIFHNASVGSYTAFLKAFGEMPKRLKTILNELPAYRASTMSVAGESMEASPGQVTRALGRMFQWSHESVNVPFGSKVTYHTFMERVAAKGNKYGYATENGIRERARLKDLAFLDHIEVDRLKRALHSDISTVQYIYDAPGLPGIFRTAGLKSAFRLQSFQMNYFGNYLSRLWTEARTGRPVWARPGENIKLPATDRLQLAKHFVGLSVLVGIASRAGVNFSDVVGVSIDPWAQGDEPKIKTGILQFRPSPIIDGFNGLVQAIGGADEYQRMVGRRKAISSLGMPITGMVAPGALAAKTLQRAATEKDLGVIVFRKPYKEKKKVVFKGVPTLAQTTRKYGF